MPNKLIGTGANQVPVNGMLGELAFQSKENVNFTGGTGKLSKLDLEAISAQLGVTAVDVFVYDTRKDSDGGAWRKRCASTSWYNETLNTSVRGSRKDFPAVAVIVVTTSSLTIYDADDVSLPMWMVWNSSTSYWGNNTINGVVASNGWVFLSNNAGSNNHGIGVLGFPNDIFTMNEYMSTFMAEKPISMRNSGIPIRYSKCSHPFLQSNPTPTGAYPNNMAISVLPNAQIDNLTGLQLPTLVIACGNGVYVLKSDGSVEVTDSANIQRVGFIKGDRIAYGHRGGSEYGGRGINIAPFRNSIIYGFFGNSTIPSLGAMAGDAGLIYGVNDGHIYAHGDSNNGTGFKRIYENEQDSTKGMVCYTTTKYNTGWMLGDIKGAWLSDSTQETLVGSNLITNGDFSSGTTGWTADGNTSLTVTAGQATITQTATSGMIYALLPALSAGTYTFSMRHVGGTHANVYAGIQNASTGTTQYTLLIASNMAGIDTTLMGTFTTTGLAANAYRIAVYGYYWGGTAAGSTIIIDDLVLRRADDDRSVNGKGLQVYGSITKTPVATGTDLVAYSGFSAGNYLYQPYNSALDMGTGSYSVMFWAKTTSGGGVISRGPSDTDEMCRIRIDGSTYGVYFDYGTSAQYCAFANAADKTAMIDGNWKFVVCHVTAGKFPTVYVNGVKMTTTSGGAAPSTFTTSNSYVTYIGCEYGNSLYFSGSIALLRFSATVPSAEQVAKIYNDEKQLFQDNAKATLYGSNLVMDIAYDTDTQLLHVGTSSGRSIFEGLRRIDNTTTAVSAAISASNGLVAEQ